jgi:hypothetical protein
MKYTEAEQKQLTDYIFNQQKTLGAAMVLIMGETNATSMKETMVLTGKDGKKYDVTTKVKIK